MKIIALMKRFATNTNRDQIVDNFGREVRLLSELAKVHDVTVFCGDHTLREDRQLMLNGMRVLIVPLWAAFPGKFLTRLNNELKRGKYDWLFATSDAAFGAVGYVYARLHRLSFAYDLRDNYETYDDLRRGVKAPFVRLVHNRAVREAELVSCVSEALMEKVQKRRKKRTIVVENGIELDVFKPMDKKACRKALGLAGGTIACYLGHISREKGVDVLLDACAQLNSGKQKVTLLLSGKVDKGIDVTFPWIAFKELRKRTDVVKAVNAADVCVLPNVVNEFTRYCFPYKLFEYLACDRPVVATAVGAVADVLAGEKDALCAPGDVQEMSRKIILNAKKRVAYRSITEAYTWEKLGAKLAEAFSDG